MEQKDQKKARSAEITTRLKRVIEYTAKNKQRFAKELGYHPQKIYDITTEKVRPDVEFLRRMCEHPMTDKINVRWLITGKGNMIMGEDQAISKAVAFIKALLQTESRKIATLLSEDPERRF